MVATIAPGLKLVRIEVEPVHSISLSHQPAFRDAQRLSNELRSNSYAVVGGFFRDHDVVDVALRVLERH